MNPVLLALAGPFAAGWAVVAEFIFCLAMALKCYPLPPGGLLALEAVLLGLATPASVYKETAANLSVILLLVFMVAGIHFMQDFLRDAFTSLLLRVRSKPLLAVLFCAVSGFLSAFLDALTVTAVVIAVAYGFYDTYIRVACAGAEDDGCAGSEAGRAEHRETLERFRRFLRTLVMHAVVGTALGGVTTLVGEPQNLLIGSAMGWSFTEFFLRAAPVSVPVLLAGLAVCWLLERFRLFGYGHPLPEAVREVLAGQTRLERSRRSPKARARVWVQAGVGALLVLALALHLAEVGLIGLGVIVLLTACTGVTDEHRIGRAFTEALPFTALLVVFFAVVAVIHDQHLFRPVIDHVLGLEGRTQLVAYYLANGLLSAISDNVFVATVYISETMRAFEAGQIAREQLDLLAVAINTGTNIPSIATPNGQAAFLFLLTSTLAPLIRLSYGRMVLLALPYTLALSAVGLAATWLH